MEILIAALVELTGLLILPVIVFVGDLLLLGLQLISLCIEVCVEALFGTSFLSQKKDSPKEKQEHVTDETAQDEISAPPVVAGKSTKRFNRRNLKTAMIWGSGICFVLLLVMLLVVAFANALFFDSTVRIAFRHIERKTGITISFNEADGNLWRGELRLHDVSISRPSHPVSQIDLKADTITLNLSLSDFLKKKYRFESVTISRLSGNWDQLEKNDRFKPKRKFRIDNLSLDRIQLRYSDQTRPNNRVELAILVDSAQVIPLRSNWALYDFLFRGDVKGSINTIPFEIESLGNNNRCRMDNIPLVLLGNLTGEPFNWFEKGKVDINIGNKLEEKGGMDVDWALVFHDFHVRLPEEMPLKWKVAYKPLCLFLNTKSERLPLKIDFHLNEDNFEFNTSEEIQEIFRHIVTNEVVS